MDRTTNQLAQAHAEERALREGLQQGRARLTDLLAGRQSDDMEANAYAMEVQRGCAI